MLISPEQFIAAYKNLPPPLQEALFSQNTEKSIERIVSSFELSEKANESLTKTIGYVLSGFLPMENFSKIFTEESGIDEKTADEISQEVYSTIFYPVIESLKSFSAPKNNQLKTIGRMKVEIEKAEVPLPESYPEPQRKRGPDRYREPTE